MYLTTAHVSCKPHSQPRKTHTYFEPKKIRARHTLYEADCRDLTGLWLRLCFGVKLRAANVPKIAYRVTRAPPYSVLDGPDLEALPAVARLSSLRNTLESSPSVRRAQAAPIAARSAAAASSPACFNCTTCIETKARLIWPASLSPLTRRTKEPP